MFFKNLNKVQDDRNLPPKIDDAQTKGRVDESTTGLVANDQKWLNNKVFPHESF